MADNQLTKTVYYLRARRDDKLFNLQNVIARARKIKSTVGESEIVLGAGDVLRIQHYKDNGGYVYLHLARYTPGIVASTLLPKAKSAEDNEGTQSAPAGKEFKDGDCFIVVKKHNVLYCGHGISLPKATLYLSQLFHESSLDKISSGFSLLPASNINKLNLMQEHGVRSVELSVGAFKMSLPKKQRDNWVAKAFGTVGDEFSALLKKDESPKEQKALEDLLVNLEIRLDGNTRAAPSSKEFIENLAETVLDDTESPISEFVIRTQSDERITSNEIRLQTRIKADKKDNSVSHISVWSALNKYFMQLANDNLLEQ